MPDRPGRAGDHGDGRRSLRQRALPRAIEQPFRGKPGLERLELQREVAEAGRLKVGDIQLVHALGIEDVDAAVSDNPQPGLRLERRCQPVVAEPDAAQLAAVVLEREVAVPGRGDRHPADLAFDPHVPQSIVSADRLAHGAGDVADGEDREPERPGWRGDA